MIDQVEQGDVKWSGSCMCGKVEYVVRAPERGSGICHCQNCCKFSGSDYYRFLSVDPKTFEFVKGADEVGKYSSEGGDGMYRYWCKTCGTYLSCIGKKYDWCSLPVQNIHGYAGTPAATFHCFVSSKVPWTEINDELTQFQKFPE
mmetsp:Transcript_10092/g.18182  ORF Transcript_10092/g.18182 Transcript_10092/m.18182 type:complete len:145 (-) Transcript_10092:901-1335(-)